MIGGWSGKKLARSPLEREDGSGIRLCTCWGKVSEARVDGERHHCHEIILRYVQAAPDEIQWQTDRQKFDEMMATKKRVGSRS